MKTDGNGSREGTIRQIQQPNKKFSDRKQKKKLGEEHMKLKEMEQHQANVVKHLENPDVLYMQHVIEQQQRDGIVFTK